MGFVDNLGKSMIEIRSKDRFIEKFPPKAVEEIEIMIKPRRTRYPAKGRYRIGMAVVNRERKHSLSLKTIEVKTGNQGAPPELSEASPKVISRGATRITLGWTAPREVPGGGPYHFLVYRLPPADLKTRFPQSKNLLVSKVSGSNQCTINGLAPGKTYRFKIVAEDRRGQRSEYKEVESFTEGAEDISPLLPGNNRKLIARPATVEEVSRYHDNPYPNDTYLKWDPVSEGKGTSTEQIVYKVYLSMNSPLETIDQCEFLGRNIATLRGKSDFVIREISKDTRYYLNIVAMNRAGKRCVYRPLDYRIP